MGGVKGWQMWCFPQPPAWRERGPRANPHGAKKRDGGGKEDGEGKEKKARTADGRAAKSRTKQKRREGEGERRGGAAKGERWGRRGGHGIPLQPGAGSFCAMDNIN